jgi:hypothetical protein
MKNLRVLLGLSATLLMGAGFEKGNVTTITRISGDVTMRCRSNNGGGEESAHIRCDETLYDPGEFDFFVMDGPVAGQPDQAVLTARWPDGSTHAETQGFDAAKARSTRKFNLWANTLFQRALLDFGANDVHYELKQKRSGRALMSGDFKASGVSGEERRCPWRTYYSSDIHDCRGSTSRVCDRYFFEERDCK